MKLHLPRALLVLTGCGRCTGEPIATAAPADAAPPEDASAEAGHRRPFKPLQHAPHLPKLNPTPIPKDSAPL